MANWPVPALPCLSLPRQQPEEGVGKQRWVGPRPPRALSAPHPACWAVLTSPSPTTPALCPLHPEHAWPHRLGSRWETVPEASVGRSPWHIPAPLTPYPVTLRGLPSGLVGQSPLGQQHARHSAPTWWPCAGAQRALVCGRWPRRGEGKGTHLLLRKQL